MQSHTVLVYWYYLLSTRLAKESKHICLVEFYTRLVKRIDAKHIAAYSHRKFKEVEKFAKVVLCLLRYLDEKCRHISIHMSRNSHLHSALIYIVHGLA